MKAVITAGGKGTRLYPISRAYPKELIPFCGIPVIEYSINILRDNGIKDILILAGTKKGALQDYLGNGIEHLLQPEKYGVVKFDGLDNDINNIIDLYEKPRDESIKEKFKTNSGWYAIAGIYIFNKNIFNYLRETPKGFNNEIQLTDAVKLSLDKGNKILGYIFNGRRIDVGTWDYLVEEKNFYNSLDQNKLREIINNRNIMMNKINGNI